jgi:hypothetical protein
MRFSTRTLFLSVSLMVSCPVLASGKGQVLPEVQQLMSAAREARVKGDHASATHYASSALLDSGLKLYVNQPAKEFIAAIRSATAMWSKALPGLKIERLKSQTSRSTSRTLC